LYFCSTNSTHSPSFLDLAFTSSMILSTIVLSFSCYGNTPYDMGGVYISFSAKLEFIHTFILFCLFMPIIESFTNSTPWDLYICWKPFRAFTVKFSASPEDKLFRSLSRVGILSVTTS
jgi:hypothetical protein